MAVGGNAAYSGEGEAERQLLEGELRDAECALLGEVQQIERLAQENNSKVRTQAIIPALRIRKAHCVGLGWYDHQLRLGCLRYRTPS